MGVGNRIGSLAVVAILSIPPDASLVIIKSALKRGALITAANWELVVIQFVAESAFKALLVVPVVGAAFLLALLAGDSVLDLLDGGLQDALAAAIAGLQAHPGALIAYLLGLGVVVIGGSMLMFTIKGGTVHVLVDAERRRAGRRGRRRLPSPTSTSSRALPSIGLARAATASGHDSFGSGSRCSLSTG